MHCESSMVNIVCTDPVPIVCSAEWKSQKNVVAELKLGCHGDAVLEARCVVPDKKIYITSTIIWGACVC